MSILRAFKFPFGWGQCVVHGRTWWVKDPYNDEIPICEHCLAENISGDEPMKKTDSSDALLWAFEYMYHMDKANACLNCSPVTFSNLTHLLMQDLLSKWPSTEDITQEMAEVRDSNYHEDDCR